MINCRAYSRELAYNHSITINDVWKHGIWMCPHFTDPDTETRSKVTCLSTGAVRLEEKRSETGQKGRTAVSTQTHSATVTVKLIDSSVQTVHCKIRIRISYCSWLCRRTVSPLASVSSEQTEAFQSRSPRTVLCSSLLWGDLFLCFSVFPVPCAAEVKGHVENRVPCFILRLSR